MNILQGLILPSTFYIRLINIVNGMKRQDELLEQEHVHKINIGVAA